MTFLPDQFSSVTQSYPILFKPVDCSTSGFPVHHHLLKLMAIKSMIPSHHLILCCPLLLLPQSFPASGSSPVSQFFPSGGQSIGASALVSVLPMNGQGWFPLGLTGLISLQSKGLKRAFSNTTIQKHQFFGTQISLCSNSYSYRITGKTTALTYGHLSAKWCLCFLITV